MLAAAKKQEYTVTVDLESQVVIVDSDRLHFPYDPFRRHCLLNGLDDIDYIRTFDNDIGQFRSKQEKECTFSTLVPNH